MTSPCHVRQYLEAERAKIASAHPVSDKRTWGCSGPLVECLLGVTREAVEKAAPLGVVLASDGRWMSVRSGGYADFREALTLDELLHRLSTQECPECHGSGKVSGFSAINPDGKQPCPICHGTGRIGSVCTGHAKLVRPTPGTGRLRYTASQLDPASLPPTDPVLLNQEPTPAEKEAQELRAQLDRMNDWVHDHFNRGPVE